MKKIINHFVILTTVMASFAGFIATPSVTNAESMGLIDFETLSTGTINGQDGWSSLGAAGSGCAVYDHAVDSSYSVSGFGNQSLRISNAATSGCFGDQTFSKSLVNEAGEVDSTSNGMSGGVRQPHFEAQFSFASTSLDQQPGLFVSVSPDRGDGSRMSYLGFSDEANGIDVIFYDTPGTSNPANFSPTTVATGLSRSTPHTAKFSIDYINGPSNDVVKIYIDGVLVHTGTTWENYYRFDSEASGEQAPRTTDSLIFRTGGTAAPGTAGKGFLFDNLSQMSGPIPSDNGGETCTDLPLVSSTNTQFKGLTTTDPSGGSSDGLFTQGTAGPAVIAGPTGFPGAWDTASADPDVTGANWVNNSADQPNNPADGNPGGDGSVNTWRLFSDTFNIPANATSISSPVLHFTADNSVEAFLDGTSIGSSPTFNSVADTSPLTLTTGNHEFKFVVKNDAYQGFDNPTGLLYKATVSYCVPNTPPPTSSTVHIFKYIDGEQATTQNADGVNFPMFTATYNAPFTLGPAGWTNGDIAYEASTSPMNIGSSYTAEETFNTSLVGATCDGSHDYALVGYSTGDTLEEAQQGEPSLNSPSFTNLQGDKYIIVRNHKCESVPQIKVHILKYLDGQVATTTTSNGYQFPMTATWKTANLNGGASASGNYVLGNYHGGAPNQYGADTSPMNVPADYTTSELTGGDSLVVNSVDECTPGKYILNGYRTSSLDFTAAAAASLTTVAPVFTALNADQYIIIDNSKCPTTGTISGMKYNDKNENGKKGNNEPGLAGWTIQLKSGNTVVATTVTDANGNYTFSNVAPGTYKVREVHQKGWKRRSKNPKAIVITAGSTVTDVNFGNSKKEKKEKEDSDRDDNRDDQSGEYHSNHGHSNYEQDQNKKDRKSD